MMQPGYGHQPQFPPSLDAVPPEAYVTETFAFTPGALAIGGVLGLAGSLFGLANRGFRSVEDAYLPAACFVGAVLFATWEIWRRSRKTSVAFLGPQIGVYRQGQLRDVAYRTQIAVYQLRIINTIREIMGFGMFALIGVGGGLATLGANPEMGLTFLGGGIGFLGALISSLYARIGCRHFFIPKGNSTEQVMFTHGAIGRFGV